MSITLKEEYSNCNKFLSKKHTTILKGIAIIFVLFNHIGMQYGIHITNILGPIGVCMFLTLSGYGINESFKIKGRKSYIQSRVKKVILPYWIIIICLSIYYFFIDSFSASNILKYSAFITIPTEIYWYLQFILWCYIIYYFVSFISERKIKILLMFIFSICFSILNKDKTLYLWQTFSFPIGVLISECYEKIKINLVNKNNNVTLSVFCILSILSLGFKAMPINRTYNQEIIAQITMSISVTMFIVFASYKLLNLKVWRIIKFIGRISYELYLVHPFFLSMLSGKSVGTLITFMIIIGVLSIMLNKIILFLHRINGINRKNITIAQ